MTKPEIVKHRLEEKCTSIKNVQKEKDGYYKATVEITGGYSLMFDVTDRYRVNHILGTGEGETITIYIEDKTR